MVSLDVLKGFSLLKGLDDSELGSVAMLCREVSRKTGDCCFRQGEKAEALHLCRSGEVAIVVQIFEPWSMRVTLDTVRAGDSFGWSALVEPRRYTASAECLGDVEEIFMNNVDLFNLFERNHHIGYVMMRNLSTITSSRLTEMTEKLTVEMANPYACVKPNLI